MAQGQFAGKRVLVTGAAAGIGQAVAQAFAREGAEVLAADINAKGLADCAAAISRSGGHAETLVYDAAEPGASARMAEAAAASRLDVCVNVAGVYHRAHFAETTPEDWNRIIQINLGSVAEICRAVLPALIESRGTLINTASTAGLRGIAYAAPYAAAKGGVIALTKSLASEFAHRGVRVNAVAPGRVATGIGAGLAPVVDAQPGLSLHPVKLAGFEDGAPAPMLAGTYLWLASPQAGFVTGTVQVVDGGALAG
jgi:meso-butanediol dehydrogenase / (S,S)-butanediol dehydrogenase / diacetyl reductase